MFGMYDCPKLFRLEHEVSHNSKVKFYPDGNHNLTVASKPIFKEKGWTKAWETEKISKPKSMNGEVRDDNVRRAQQKVLDISRLNNFRWFITWTLDKKKIDRYSTRDISKKLKIFLMHKAQRNAAVYLVIPEYHKDGAIHMHGLLAGDFKMVDSGRKAKGDRTIYNMPEWKFGHSTAIELDENIGAISRYITKYISKDFRKIFGSFYYAGGHGLVREPPTQLYDLDYCKVNAKEYTNKYLSFKYANLGDCASDNGNAILEILNEQKWGLNNERTKHQEI